MSYLMPDLVKVLCLFMYGPFVTGQYTLSGSDSYGTPGTTFTFTCTTSPVQIAVTWGETYTISNGNRNTANYIYVYNDGQCVRSTGAPPSDYSFNCDSSGVFTLTFTVSYTRHQGSIWTCGNAQGPGVSDSITLDVRVPLTSVTLLNTNSSTLTVTQDNVLSLVCETNPTEPVSTITWRKGSQTVSQDVTSSSRSETQGTVAVSVWSKSVQWEDRGDYSCVATNSGTTRTSQTLSLAVRVLVSSVTLTNITNNNQEISLTEDSTLVLSCQTSFSYPAPTVTWYINDSITSSGVVSQIETQVSGQVVTVSTMTRTARRTNDRDQIYCRAENGFGDTQSWTARVNVYYGPDNDQISLSKSSAVAERIPVTLTCSTLTSVNPEVDFSWSYSDNTQITSGKGVKQGSARSTWSQTLTVTPVRDSNRQVVRCDVGNTLTSVDLETTLDLDVNYGPADGEIQVTKSSTAIEHDPVTLTCRTTNNIKPDVTFTWTLDGSEVTSGTGSKQGSSGSIWSQTLTLTPTRDQRTVGCTVSNSLISRQGSSSVDLDVNYPPDIGIIPVEGTEKADLTLRCNASGNPSIYQFKDFTQYWGNQLIQRRAGSQSGDRYDLTLSRVTYQDSGVYVCTVGNNVKQPRHRNTTVIVKGSPLFTKDSISYKDVSAEVGQNLSIIQHIYCRPNYTLINWNFTSGNTTINHGSTSSTITLSQVHLDVYGVDVETEGHKLSFNVINLQQKDIGVYTVSVCNSVGCTSSSVSLTRAGPPVMPMFFKAVTSTTVSIILSWIPQSAGGEYVQEFHVEYRTQSSSEWMLKIFPEDNEDIMIGVIDGLKSDTVYVFRIKSVSDRKTGSNQSQYSDAHSMATLAKDDPLSTSPTSTSLGLGAGIGIGVGISVIVVIAAVVIFVIAKRRNVLSTRNQNKRRDTDTDTDRQLTDITTTISAVDQSQYVQLQPTTNPNQYETLDGHDYQNADREIGRNVYETLDKNQTQEYESLDTPN